MLERLITSAVELMECGETVRLEKGDNWVEQWHMGGAISLPLRYPGIKPHTFAGHKIFEAPDPMYLVWLEAWKIVSPETFESGKWEFPKPVGRYWCLEDFTSAFAIGAFSRIEMFENGNFIAFEKSTCGDPSYDEFKFDADSEYANYMKSKVGKINPGEIVTFEANPLWKKGNKSSGDPYLPRKLQA